MIGEFSESKEVRKLEAGFMLLSLYKEYCKMKLDVARVGKLIDSSSYFILEDFRSRSNDLKARLNTLISELLEKGYGNPELLEEKARKDEKKQIIEKIEEISEGVEELKKNVIAEINFSLEVLASIIERYPADRVGIEPRFLAGRLKELSKGLEMRPSVYLGVFIGLIMGYFPRFGEEKYEDLNKRLDDLRDTLLSTDRVFGETLTEYEGPEMKKETIRNMIKKVDYIRFYISRYRQLIPAAERLVEEIEAEVYSFRGKPR